MKIKIKIIKKRGKCVKSTKKTQILHRACVRAACAPRFTRLDVVLK